MKTLKELGIAGNGSDVTAALNTAFLDAQAGGYGLAGEDDAVYGYSGLIEMRGVSFDGRGCTFRALADADCAFRTFGSGWHVRNFSVELANTIRSADNRRNGLWIGGSGPGEPDNFAATDFILENVHVTRAAPGKGAGAAGFYINNAQRGAILDCSVRHSFADAFHVVNGSSALNFERLYAQETGDDAFAVVSYTYHALCRDISWSNCRSVDTLARGITVAGGININHWNPQIIRSSAAAVIMVSEIVTDGSTVVYETFGVHDCHVHDLYAEDCVTAVGSPPNFTQAAILLAGRSGSNSVNGRTISQEVVDCSISGSVQGMGAGGTDGVILREHVVRPVCEDVVLVGTRGGFRIAGKDARIVRPVLRDMLDVPFTIMPTAGGRIVIQRALCSGVSDNFVNANVYLSNAPDVAELAFEDAEFINSQPKLFHLAGFDLTKLRHRGLRHNGVRITGKDYEEGAATFSNGWTGSNLRIVKLPEGRVALYGVAIAGATSDGTLIMTLPAGFRPVVEDYHRPTLMDGGGTASVLRFETDGDVYALSGVTGAIRFNGLTFMAA